MDDEGTWPSALMAVVTSGESVLRGFQDEEVRFLNDTVRGGRYLPAAEREPNAFWQKRETVLEAVADVVRGHRLRGYHCTRLTDSEVAEITAHGMTLPNLAMLRRRIAQLVKQGIVTPKLADRLARENDADKASRTNMIWFVFTPELLRDQLGVGDLFQYWGGEALYSAHDRDRETGPVLKSIGHARIVVGAVPVAGLGTWHTCSEIITRRYLAARGVPNSQIDYEGRIGSAIPATDILRVISRRETDFQRLTGCEGWKPKLR